MQEFEKLGLFYLGRLLDPRTRDPQDQLLLYDSRDLTTHAVVVGMTGSGKTGLCVNLLEEAALDSTPALVIDPKGDIANLLLTFPDLSAEDFRPWIDEAQADRQQQSADQFAAAEAEKWSAGLRQWGQDGQRIARLRQTVEMRVYTPGSLVGRPLNVLRSFASPPTQVLRDPDALRERIASAASGLLALLGIDADPIRSREHILISRIFQQAWGEGRDLNLAKLIGEVQSPPIERVGVMELDAFFPAKDRAELAMTLNNLLAAPAFSSWLEGEGLEINRLLHTAEGKPVVSILSIAHLSDAERMFFVTVVLNEVLGWMRGQTGTSSLRAVLYMDEVFGFCPPTANPPSKQPLLTLLKQARAFGLGIVLATQNPVDLDYKGLSNTGTWFLGRLQTERDKLRVIDGLQGAAASTGAAFNREEIERTLSGLRSRMFVMNNVHDDGPVVFQTRWAMSYLRGPLTRAQLKQLIDRQPAPEYERQAMLPASSAAAIAPLPAHGAEPQDPRQLIPHEVAQRVVASTLPPALQCGTTYRAAILASGRLHYSHASCKIDAWQQRTFLLPAEKVSLADGWTAARRLKGNLVFAESFLPDARCEDVPPALQKLRTHQSLQRGFRDFLYREQALTVWKCQELKVYSRAEENLADFRARLELIVSEKRDQQLDRLRQKYQVRFRRLRDQMQNAQRRIDQERGQYHDAMVAAGTSILGAILGRRSGRVATSIRGTGRAARQRGDVARARQKMDELHARHQELENQFNQDAAQLADKLNAQWMQLDELIVRPRKSDIEVCDWAMVWTPWSNDPSGSAHPASAVWYDEI